MIIFLSIVIVLSIGFIVFQQLKLRAYEKKLIVLESNALQSCLNPHFIYNMIASVQEKLLNSSQSDANKSLIELSKYLRYFLRSSLTDVEMIRSRENSFKLSLKEEIDFLKLYLIFQKYQNGDILNYEIIVDDKIDLEQTFIPPMMLQPFVENSIKHGILPSKSSGNVIIEFTKTAKNLFCIIEDDGVGMDTGKNLDKKEYNEVKKMSLATQIIDKRIDLFSKLNQDIKCNINDRPEGGTIVELIFENNL